jgi:hypothetical protein
VPPAGSFRLLARPFLESFLDGERRFHRLACILGAPEVFAKDSYWSDKHQLVAFINSRRAGPFISASLAQAYCTAWRNEGAAPASVTLPYGQLARRLGVSRSHIYNAFAAAQAAGLLQCDDAGRRIVLSESSRADLMGYYADELAFIAQYALKAYRLLAP